MENVTKSVPPRRVAFVDNGFLQRRHGTEKQKGGVLLRALGRYGGTEGIDIGFSPFFWLELAGIPNAAIEAMDKECDSLPKLEAGRDLQSWLRNSLEVLLQDKSDVGNLVNQKIATRIQAAKDEYLPIVGGALFAAWNNGQKDCELHKSLIRHLAIDRLAVRLSRKHIPQAWKKAEITGAAIIASVAKLLTELPGLGPYRLMALAWDAVHQDKRFQTDDKYQLRDNSDLLDGDLVTRSALRLDQIATSPIVLTSDNQTEFQSRRNRFVSTCLYINEKTQELSGQGYPYRKLELVNATVGFVSASNDVTFAEMTSSEA